MKLLSLSLTIAAIALAAAAPAHAAAPEIGIADDRVLLWGGPDADAAVARWAELGVDVVRIHALWSRIAPDAASRTAPSGFDAADPSSAGYAWAQVDGAVDRVRGAGLRVMLTITGPGPLWATANPASGDARLRPRPDAYAAFATAVARRYGSRVSSYVLWNEPNQPDWLRPQSTCSRGHCTPAAPHLYRELVRAAEPAVKAADPGATVLMGALAPRGQSATSTNAKLRPLAFLRAMGCVDSRYRATRSGPCKGFQPAVADGFAYHPHGMKSSPSTPFSNSDDVSLASLSRLESALDRIQGTRGLKTTSGRRFDLWLDELGWQTNPPDRFLGVAASTQDRWLQQAAYLAARDPRVRNVTQYVWRDEPVGAGGTGWQSGLLYADGRAKPALAHFARPFWLDASRGRLWGQVRPGAGHDVEVQRRLHTSSAWRTVATVVTGSDGAFTRSLRLIRGASYRYVAGGTASAAIVR